jgi:hypothetical protein
VDVAVERMYELVYRETILHNHQPTRKQAFTGLAFITWTPPIRIHAGEQQQPVVRVLEPTSIADTSVACNQITPLAADVAANSGAGMDRKLRCGLRRVARRGCPLPCSMRDLGRTKHV